jgi:hypothetical protein
VALPASVSFSSSPAIDSVSCCANHPRLQLTGASLGVVATWAQVQNFGPKFTIFGEFRFYRPDPVKVQTSENISAFFEFFFSPT